MPTLPASDQHPEQFLNRALPRIRRYMMVLAVVGVVTCLVFFRWPVAAGFAVGAIVSYFNHQWLEKAIDSLGDRITQQGSTERGGIIVFRALLRYVMIAAGAYVIFNVSLAALYGFLAGVCLTIGAVACEVVVELFFTLRHGT
jgi:ATP synthase I chain